MSSDAEPPAAPTSNSPQIPVSNLEHCHQRRIPAVLALTVVVICNTAAELLLKTGATATGRHGNLMGISALASWYTIGGIGFYLAAFAAWLYTLRFVPLSLAFNFTSAQLVTVPLASWLLVEGGLMPPMRLIGITLVMAGVLLLVPAIVMAEQKMEGT